MAKNRSAIKAGSAFIQLFVNDEQLVRQLKGAERKLKNFGASVASIGAKFAALGGAMTLPLISAINAASKLEETMNKFNVVFGASAKDVKSWADSFAKEVGRSEQQIADFLAGAQDLFVPVGFEPGQAEELSKQITGLAIDLASFNNMADADVLRDLKAALTGSSEVMKKYGVITNETAVKQQLLNEGIDPKGATEQQKVMSRLTLMLKGTVAAQGDAVRSAKSYENQMKRLKGIIFDTSAALGATLIPIVTPLVELVGNVAKSIKDWVQENEKLGGQIALVFGAVVSLAAGFTAAGLAIWTAGAVLGALSTIAGTVSLVLGGLATILGSVSAATIVVGAGMATAITWMIHGGKISEWLGDKFAELKEDFGDTILAIIDALKNGDITSAVKLLWAAVRVEWLKGLEKLNMDVGNVKKAVLDTWADLSYGMTKIFLDVYDNLRLIISDIQSLFTGPFAAIMAAYYGVDKDELTSTLKTKDKARRDAIVSGNIETQAGLDAAQKADKKKRDAEFSAEIEQASAALKDASEELKAAIKGQQRNIYLTPTSTPKPDRGNPPNTDEIAKKGSSSGVLGSFNAAALLSLQAVSNHDMQMLKESKRTADNTEEIKNNQPTFGQ